MAALLSIVIPVHNGERWLDAALRSTIAAASGFAAELIVVDDGSTDGSIDVAESVASRTNGIVVRILRNPSNLGIVNALNRGLDAASGRFIARMDADDICLANRFRTQIAFLESAGCDICGSWFVEFGQGISRSVRWPHTEPALRAAMLFQNSLLHPSVLAKREVFDRYRYRQEYQLVEDYDLFGRAMREYRIANVPVSLLRYRRHRMQSTQVKLDRMEAVTRRVRIEVLASEGIIASNEEARLHNLIRSPNSIQSLDDLRGIDAWLQKLTTHYAHPDARAVIGSQWLRACIRAAPLGGAMWRAFNSSPFATCIRGPARLDLAILALSRLDYRSSPFAFLRRWGLSA
ncbi:glycosyltransferase family 2 protein [Frateuria sp. YIM B11624]|uniref:glycosyltransferase family 2 protein n=1 Tax=Frateuria sp. YIM B11624 TaxID=3143185 RepID=UPI003C7282EF